MIYIKSICWEMNIKHIGNFYQCALSIFNKI